MTETKRHYVTTWYFSCDGKDNQRGCFDADFEGVCSAYFKSRKYNTKEEAESAAKNHMPHCHFRGTTHVYNERKLVPVDEDQALEVKIFDLICNNSRFELQGIIIELRKEDPDLSEESIRKTIYRLLDRGELAIIQPKKM